MMPVSYQLVTSAQVRAAENDQEDMQLIFCYGASTASASSEEHTAELQSPNTKTYAVFCLNKKKNNNKQKTTKKQTKKN